MSDVVLSPVGELRDWMVKGFPTVMRQAITTAAERRGVTVAAFLIAHFEAHGIDGEAVKPVNLPRGKPAADPDRLDRLARLARATTPEGKDSRPMQMARAAVADELRSYRAEQGPPVAKAEPKRIPTKAREPARLTAPEADAAE